MSKNKKEKFETQDKDKQVEKKKETRPYNKITDNQMFDIEENMMMSILHNLKRADAIANARHYCESIELVDVPERRLIKIYNAAYRKLSEYKMEGIAQEKEKIVKRLYRIGSKAEMRGDFANAYKCYNRIAEIAGVDKENDDSKVILNFIPAPKKKIVDAETILDTEFKEEKDKNDKS